MLPESQANCKYNEHVFAINTPPCIYKDTQFNLTTQIKHYMDIVVKYK